MIEVGEYVRTRKGIIGILRGQYIYGNGAEYPEPQEWVIDRFNNKRNYYVTNEADVDFDEIVKHSKNIIDLIEEGDFVNGFPLLEPVYNGNVWWGVDEGYEQFKRAFGDIKSIVTHEQFKSIEYRLED